MSDSASLKFDKMEVDITLAQEYFKKKNNTFTYIHNGQPVEANESTTCILDQCKNKVYCTFKNGDFVRNPATVEPRNWTTPGDALWQLAKKIEENGELFCQLQHASTNYPIEDIRNCDLPLFINKCLHISSLMDKYLVSMATNISTLKTITWDRPWLYLLSEAVSSLWSGCRVILVAPPRMAAVCTLFLDLCAQVGLHPYVTLTFSEKTPSISGVEGGCIGIVSETADLDSAVHAFVSSTTHYPWSLKALLIQESVYEEFQRALEWKCNVNGSDEQRLCPKLQQASADVQVAGGKIFLLDYMGRDVKHPKLHPVLVSAYRTTKELLSIMSKYKANPFVSLWSCDAAQAHEIAFSLSTPCVWINNYAVFNGPAQISNALPLLGGQDIIICFKEEVLTTIATAWRKLDLERRREVILEVVRKYLASSERPNEQLAIRLQTVLKTQKPGFFEVSKNHMWIGVESPVGMLYVQHMNETRENVAYAVASTVYGNSLVVSSELADRSLLKVLRAAGVPIGAGSGCGFPFKLFNTRAIYTSFGTIFAN
ncbi:uncharacterized protein LOC119188343 [Manduca sexta]|uniref:uncharacterized protein LOC119188343 n=1 Tax=Manduca sexta TaxID=7130 RepID=UPI00188F0B74|nr:uncharacterized protein LOC119188343 [Manduca sexta]